MVQDLVQKKKKKEKDKRKGQHKKKKNKHIKLPRSIYHKNRGSQEYLEKKKKKKRLRYKASQQRAFWGNYRSSREKKDHLPLDVQVLQYLVSMRQSLLSSNNLSIKILGSLPLK